MLTVCFEYLFLKFQFNMWCSLLYFDVCIILQEWGCYKYEKWSIHVLSLKDILGNVMSCHMCIPSPERDYYIKIQIYLSLFLVSDFLVNISRSS